MTINHWPSFDLHWEPLVPVRPCWEPGIISQGSKYHEWSTPPHLMQPWSCLGIQQHPLLQWQWTHDLLQLCQQRFCLATVHALSKWGAILNSPRIVHWSLRELIWAAPFTAQLKFEALWQIKSKESVATAAVLMPRAQDALFTPFENERDRMNHHSALCPWLCFYASCVHRQGQWRLIDGLSWRRPNAAQTHHLPNEEKETPGG